MINRPSTIDRHRRLPAVVWIASAASFLATAADTFLLFTLVWVAEPQGWTGMQTAAVILLLRLPVLAGGVLGGRAVDRWGSRRVITVDTAVRAGLMIGLAALGRHGDLPLLGVLVLGGLAGVLSPATYAGVRSLVYRLVEPSELSRANAAVSVGEQLQLLVGSALVGPALLLLEPGLSPLVPAALLVVASLLARRLPTAEAARSSAAAVSFVAVPATTAGRPGTRVIAIVALSTAYYFVYGPFEAATPAFVRDRLLGSESTYSLLWTVFAVGSLASLPLAPVLARTRPGMVNALGALAWGVAMLPLAWTGDVWIAAMLFLLGGVLWGPYTAVEATALHRWVPPSRHGQVFGMQRSLLATAAPLGAATGAVGLEWFSAPAVLGASATACACAGLLALAHRGLRDADGSRDDPARPGAPSRADHGAGSE